MTNTTEDRQSDKIIAERIRFACNSLGMADADGNDMARRVVATRAKSGTHKAGDP